MAFPLPRSDLYKEILLYNQGLPAERYLMIGSGADEESSSYAPIRHARQRSSPPNVEFFRDPVISEDIFNLLYPKGALVCFGNKKYSISSVSRGIAILKSPQSATKKIVSISALRPVVTVGERCLVYYEPVKSHVLFRVVSIFSRYVIGILSDINKEKRVVVSTSSVKDAYQLVSLKHISEAVLENYSGVAQIGGRSPRFVQTFHILERDD